MGEMLLLSYKASIFILVISCNCITIKSQDYYDIDEEFYENEDVDLDTDFTNPIQKRFDQFFSQRARERYLMEKSRKARNSDTQHRKYKRSGEYDDRMSGVADILFSTPGKRVGSLLQHQARTNSILKSAISQSQNQQQKRNLAKLKKILLSCLLSKNILEPKDIKVKKHFLRFG